MLHSISIKLKLSEAANNSTCDHSETIYNINSIMEGLKYPEGFNLDPRVDLESLKTEIEGMGHKVRVGYSGGCYGARDGKVHNGLEVFLDAELLSDRYIYESDGEKFECVNMIHLINQYGGELIEDLEGDAFTDACEALNCVVSRNNTYNYAGHSKDEPHFLYDADYTIVENRDGEAFLTIKFHHGGDIRGNYGSTYVYKFDCVDDICGAIYPVSHLEEEVS